ncbi:hypothetical protein AB0I28_16875 [Phytomonospora sp. NPDC050363]|uniref:hypothetical protein n=1 Tax=Phytomonospora sp. NPDC050363 TaxID=3155642 RepID=UPI00340753F2
MRKILGILGTAGFAAAALVATAAPAQAAVGTEACTLIQSEIYNGANIIQYVQGLEGCAGDVSWEVQSQDAAGNWSVWDSGTTYYNDNTITTTGDVEFPCVMRVHAEFGTQSKTTQPARNNNCGGG